MRIKKRQLSDKRSLSREILFAQNSVALGARYRRLIRGHATYLLKMPSMLVALVGHRDTSEVAAREVRLGKTRATIVRDALAKHGVAKSRMTIASFGAGMPLDSRQAPGLRAVNRRVDIIYFGPAETGGSPPIKARFAIPKGRPPR